MHQINRRLKKLWRHGAQWVRSDTKTRALYIESLFVLCSVRLSLWIFPFKSILNWIERFIQPAQRSIENIEELRLTVSQAVVRLAAYVPAATCLTQSLTLFILLKKRSDPVILRIGVAKDDHGRLLAHAWVETPDGAALSSKGSQTFSQIAQFKNDNPVLLIK